jgi:hypothetical protein
MHVIFNGEEHAVDVTVNCCGVLCVIVVACNVTEWHEIYLVSVRIL